MCDSWKKNNFSVISIKLSSLFAVVSGTFFHFIHFINTHAFYINEWMNECSNAHWYTRLTNPKSHSVILFTVDVFPWISFILIFCWIFLLVYILINYSDLSIFKQQVPNSVWMMRWEKQKTKKVNLNGILLIFDKNMNRIGLVWFFWMFSLVCVFGI